MMFPLTVGVEDLTVASANSKSASTMYHSTSLSKATAAKGMNDGSYLKR